MVVGTIVPTIIVGTATKEIFVHTIIVGTVVLTMLVFTDVPKILFLTAYYWKSCFLVVAFLQNRGGVVLQVVSGVSDPGAAPLGWY